MSEISTPRTDAQEFIPVFEHGHFPPYFTVSSGFARQLERELAEAQDRIDDLTATGIHSCGRNCKRPNCVLSRELEKARLERDNALSDWRQADTDSIRAIGERNEARESEASEARWAAQYKQERDEWFEAMKLQTKKLGDMREQRDALAVALRELMFDCLRFRIEPSDDAYKNAESSLATLEGRTE